MESCRHQQKCLKNQNVYLRFFKVAAFALMTALHTLCILSTSFMRLSPGMHFNKEVQLVKS